MDMFGIIFAVMASVTWGLVYVIDQKILTSISPVLWLALSSFVIAVLLLPVILLNKEDVRVIIYSGRSNLLLILSSQILIAISTFFIFSSIRRLGAMTASIIEITYPIFVILFSIFLLNYSLNMYFWIGTLLVFFGVFILVTLA